MQSAGDITLGWLRRRRWRRGKPFLEAAVVCMRCEAITRHGECITTHACSDQIREEAYEVTRRRNSLSCSYGKWTRCWDALRAAVFSLVV
ncbi:hypothetical protein K431DRAFT_113321 [Polychaeton citri CBS 116435]|uniref:Uncharacterized protein n=1 Tax=Polychaeton citri CBS 116435 TaxID=1314669 RepID=A0A9P4Q762_9PEZI|nr:hypothetical protein K431DRAFT_113321 [Polychaeton citri CBS 116435]